MIDLLYNFAVAYEDNSNCTSAGPFLIGSFKVNRSEFHFISTSPVKDPILQLLQVYQDKLDYARFHNIKHGGVGVFPVPVAITSRKLRRFFSNPSITARIARIW